MHTLHTNYCCSVLMPLFSSSSSNCSLSIKSLFLAPFCSLYLLLLSSPLEIFCSLLYWIPFPFRFSCSPPSCPFLSSTLQYVGADDSMLQAVFCLLACLRNLFYLLKVFHCSQLSNLFVCLCCVVVFVVQLVFLNLF